MNAEVIQDIFQYLRARPAEFWIDLGVMIGLVLCLAFLLRRGSQLAKIAVLALLVIGLSVRLSLWVYNRNEPSWLKPVVDAVAPFFPERGFERRDAGDL